MLSIKEIQDLFEECSEEEKFFEPPITEDEFDFAVCDSGIGFIRERTMAGLKAARARGRKGGRPKVNQQKLTQALAMYHSQRMTVNEIEEATGVSASIYRNL
jgi:hypothetical protein